MGKNDWVLTFSEKNKGWVSFKSFTQMQLGVSMANNYYTFFQGELFKHYSEDVDRNTFYSGQGLFDDGFTNSSLDVMLNDQPGLVKVFNTLNYEGSQSKVDRFVSDAIGEGTLDLDFQPITTYSDQEYYNLTSKKGWYVEGIVTDLEEGNISEFLEKEGKWFNNINRKIDITLDASDSGDFTFQGIGGVLTTTVNGGAVVYGCTDPSALNYNAGANANDGTCILECTGLVIDLSTSGDTGFCNSPNNDGVLQWSVSIDNFQALDTWDYDITNDVTGISVGSQQNGNAASTPSSISTLAPGCYTIYITHNIVGGGICLYEHSFCIDCEAAPIYGCTNPSASNYDASATVDNGSCVFSLTDADDIIISPIGPVAPVVSQPAASETKAPATKAPATKAPATKAPATKLKSKEIVLSKTAPVKKYKK